MTDNLELKGTVCPICGYEFKFGTPGEFADGMECCWTCGQALDWSEERGE